MCVCVCVSPAETRYETHNITTVSTASRKKKSWFWLWEEGEVLGLVLGLCCSCRCCCSCRRPPRPPRRLRRRRRRRLFLPLVRACCVAVLVVCCSCSFCCYLCCCRRRRRVVCARGLPRTISVKGALTACLAFASCVAGPRQRGRHRSHLLLPRGGRGWPAPKCQPRRQHRQLCHGRRRERVRREQLRVHTRGAHAHRVDDPGTVGHLLRQASCFSGTGFFGS